MYGSFRENKSNGKLKSTVNFADEFKDYPNVNDLPENLEDALDKYLSLKEASKIQILTTILMTAFPT